MNSNSFTLNSGDFFAVQGTGFVSIGINFFQQIWAKDNQSIHSHAGLILDADGTTLESLSSGTLDSQNLFEAYKDKQILITRYDKLTPELYEESIRSLKEEFEGEGYPFYRLFLHIFPPLSKLHFLGRAVCSEVVAYYLWKIGARHEHWASTNPGTLADEWARWKDYTLVFEGTL